MCFGGKSMATMVKYNRDYIHVAYNLVKLKSNDDDIKAGEDLYITDASLNGTNTCVNPYALDERLRKEYKTIKMMENVVDKFIFNDGRHKDSIISDEERIMNRLESDRIGIIADVLIKHEIIKIVDELYITCQNV